MQCANYININQWSYINLTSNQQPTTYEKGGGGGFRMLTQTDLKLGFGLFMNEVDLKEVESALCN
jgi:hypothetical protein